MFFAMEADATAPPPTNRQYILELLRIPDGVNGAPSIGTMWRIPLDRTFVLQLPTFQTQDGALGYQFSFTMTAAPEPGTLAAFALIVALARRQPR